MLTKIPAPWPNAPLFMIPLFTSAGYGIVKILSMRKVKEEERIRKQEERRLREEEEKRRREAERRKKAERKEIEDLIFETENMIGNAIPNAKDPVRLGGLKLLRQEVRNLSQEFESGDISYEDAKASILGLREEAKILNTPISDEEAPPQDTYYDILGVDHNANQNEIKQAYRRRMMEYHPDKIGSWAKADKVPGWVKKEADEITKKLNGAYEVLSDENRRKEYDETIGV